MHTYKATLRTPPRRQPSSETGIYLARHKHAWRETGTHTWPSGTIDPVFRCTICGDTIACPAKAQPTDPAEQL